MKIILIVSDCLIVPGPIGFVRLEGVFADGSGTSIVGTNATGEQRNILVRKMDTTSFTLPITVHYSRFYGLLISIYRNTPTEDVFSDRSFQSLLSSCDFIETSQNTVSLRYVTTIGVDLISWTGFFPSFEGTLRVPCLMTRDELDRIPF